MSARPIGDHALLSDCGSVALVTSDGSVDWLCLPRFDSPAIFTRLLDESAGHWSTRSWHPCGTDSPRTGAPTSCSCRAPWTCG
ncbi:trehalase-like domain-containing protein [Kitasatospora sp. NPDC087314]|uniref:trehalase-like domain-containing protein n=1 Tax=Kitasatospora sp. NPDC087314 TaxID=3364068 RepID=UPI00380E40A2